jgi:hypothetical protein
MQQLSYPAAAPVEAGGEHRPDAPRRCGVPKRDTSPPEVDRLASRRTHSISGENQSLLRLRCQAPHEESGLPACRTFRTLVARMPAALKITH